MFAPTYYYVGDGVLDVPLISAFSISRIVFRKYAKIIFEYKKTAAPL